MTLRPERPLPVSLTPIDLDASALHLDEGGIVRAEPLRFDPLREGWAVMTFQVETDADVHADHWEVHPNADEAVVCLTGGLRVHLRAEPGAEPEEAVLAPGTAVIVPRGRRHRMALDEPSRIMSITLPRGSRLEERDAV